MNEMSNVTLYRNRDELVSTINQAINKFREETGGMLPTSIDYQLIDASTYSGHYFEFNITINGITLSKEEE